MSWNQLVKKALEHQEVSFQDTRMGNIIVKPLKHPQTTIIILARRMQLSLDRKLEIVGVLDILEDRLGDQDRSQLLRRMLVESAELELKGVLRKSVKTRVWSELPSLTEIAPKPGSGSLLSVLSRKEVEEGVKKAGVELVEVFPRLIPAELLERHLMISSRGLMVSNLVKKYVESPQSVSWIARAHLLYGLPLGTGGVEKAFLMIIDLLKRIKDFTYSMLLPQICT